MMCSRLQFKNAVYLLLPSFVFCILMPSQVLAAVFNVPCNAPALLAALQSANTNGEIDNVNLASNCTYNFVTFNTIDGDGPNALPILSTELSIIGNGSTLRRDPTAGDFRILKVAVGGNVTLSDLKIVNGKTADAQTLVIAPPGGGILNKGVLSIMRSEISNNQTGDGAELGALPFAVGGVGGGIYSSGSLTILNSSIHSNRTGNSNSNGLDQAGAGAGINLNGGIASIRKSALYGNTVGGYPSTPEIPAADGGAIHAGSAAVLVIQNTSIFANRAIDGGAIYASGDLTMNHATIAYNANKGIYYIGGLSNTLDIKNSIISDHIEQDCFLSSGSIAVTNSLFDDSGNAACNIVNGTNSNIIGGNADLQTPGNYGGYTPGLALGASSQAINKGSNSPVDTDQRNIRRPQPTSPGQLVSDIGAFEKELLTVDVDIGLNIPIYTAKMDQWFEVELNSGDKVNFEATFTNAAGDLDVLMYHKRDLVTPVASSTTSDDDELIEFTATQTGTYWVRVFGFNGATNTFAYKITFVRDNGLCVPIKTGSKIALICV